jgi:hypothetical protein
MISIVVVDIAKTTVLFLLLGLTTIQASLHGITTTQNDHRCDTDLKPDCIGQYALLQDLALVSDCKPARTLCVTTDRRAGP